MDKAAYIMKNNTQALIEKECRAVIKKLHSLSGKNVNMDDIADLAIKFDVLEAWVSHHGINIDLKPKFLKALKAMRKIENAVLEHDTIKIEVEVEGLGNLSADETNRSPKSDLPAEYDPEFDYYGYAQSVIKELKSIFTHTSGGRMSVNQLKKYLDVIHWARFVNNRVEDSDSFEYIMKQLAQRLSQSIKNLEKNKHTIISTGEMNRTTLQTYKERIDDALTALASQIKNSPAKINPAPPKKEDKPKSEQTTPKNNQTEKQTVNFKLDFERLEWVLKSIAIYPLYDRIIKKNDLEEGINNLIPLIADARDDGLTKLVKLLAAIREHLVQSLYSFKGSEYRTGKRIHERELLNYAFNKAIDQLRDDMNYRKLFPAHAHKAISESVTPPSKGECFAEEIPIGKIHTDPSRFQNRNTAFSEQSAESVANNYDPNKFDPITVWLDPNDGRLYVLSGHSRLEGMHRRKEKKIPVKYFSGTEADAIQFARIDANRSATEESLLEDLKAYKLMRDGDKRKKIEPSAKKDLRASFKGKVNKLEKLSHLDSTGPFIRALAVEDTSEYPHIGRFAQWVGELKSELKFSSGKEDQIFTFIYSDKILKIAKMDKNDFDKLIRERLASGKDKIFDCNNGECDEPKELEDFLKNKTEAQLRKRLLEIEKTKDKVRSRFTTSNNFEKIHTPEEKTIYRQLVDDLDKEAKEINKQLNKADNTGSALFGTRRKRK